MFDPLFLIHVFLSFVIGGAATGTMTFLVQKLPQKTAGIIISLPTTMVISLFFLWLIAPQDEFISSFDIVPVGISVTILFLTSYIYIAQCFIKRSTGIFFSLLAGYTLWILFIIFLYFLGKPSLMPSFFIFFFIATLCQWALFQLPPQPDQSPSQPPFTKEIIVRIIISGGVVALSLLIAKAAGTFWGTLIGVTFPALYTSYLTLLHYVHGPRFLIKVFRLMPIGSTTYVFYAFIVREMYPLLGAWMGTLVAYAIAAAYVYILSKIMIAAQETRLKPETERPQLSKRINA